MVDHGGDVSCTPRTGSAMAVCGQRMYVWGGYTQVIEGTGDDRYILDIELPDEDENDTSIEVLHIDERQWSRYETRGSVPQLGNGSVMAAIGSHLYLFGGWNDNDFSSDIFIFDTELLTWEFVKTTENGPIPKYKAGMVVHNGKFVVFGGVGKPFNDQTGCNASYVSNKSFNFEFGYGWNNELHEFDPATRCWVELQCTGKKPPPMGDFTFTKIDISRALVYGGRLQRDTFASFFIVDLDKLHWSGPLEQESPDQHWPAARCLHTSAVLVDPDNPIATQHQKLITVWGKGADNKHVNDVWILDIANVMWQELCLSLRPRMWHMTCSYHHGGMMTDIIIYGGNKRRESKFDRHVMTGLTILRFGQVASLVEICTAVISNQWESFKLLVEILPTHLKRIILQYQQAEYSIIYPTESYLM